MNENIVTMTQLKLSTALDFVLCFMREELIVLYICDWILENRPNCHTRPIPFYWPS